MNYTKIFANLSSKDVDQAGGKGASLGEMTQAGIPVPPGYVVLSEAFDRFLEETDLGVSIQSILDTVNVEAVNTIDEASEQIQGLISSRVMPDDIRLEIEEQFEQLGAEHVAVRSSATAEDSASAAWAGQLDSFLNTTQEGLLKNVQKCWASLFTPRAIFYRFEQGLADHHISVAVVVQKMVQSETSGIAFSVHPVTQDVNQMIIEAGFGLGEAIVSGSVTPDAYVITKDAREITDVNVNVQKKKLERSRVEADRNDWIELSDKEGGARVLTESQITKLADLIVNIEQHYTFPCDIEWAYEDGEFYITQSRPITTLGDVELKSVYKKESSREYSLFRGCAFSEAIGSNAKNIIGHAVDDFCAVYRGGDLVDVYYKDQALKGLFETVVKNCQDVDAVKKTIDTFLSEFERLKEYYSGARKIKSIEDLEKFYNFYAKVWSYIGVIFINPSLDVDEGLKEAALSAREATQEYNEKPEELFKDFIHEYYPQFDEYARFILPNEIWNGDIEKPDYIERLKERAPGYIYTKNKLYTGDLNEILSSLNIEINDQESFISGKAEVGDGEFKGQVANKGRVAGVVRIVSSVKDLNKVKEGDILVAAMTMPKYITAMKRATAFVTDEGGLMCHAAIVSRETGKPCIIGTKVATQILKDGDEVEVDADNGVMRILNTKGGEEEAPKPKGAIREYTLLGISDVFKAITSKDFIDFFGGEALNEILIVIRKGDFYHFQSDEDVSKLGKAFLERVDGENIDVDEVYAEFEEKMIRLDEIFALKKEALSFEIIKEFFTLYSTLLKYAYAAAYSLDVIDIIEKEKQGKCREWIEKTRLRAENIYKFGETDFVPMIAQWLSENHFRKHSPESLTYLFSDELFAWIDDDIVIPSESELLKRKELVYCKYWPVDNSEFFTEADAEAVIKDRALFADIDKVYTDLDELTGQAAYGGVVRGRVRIIKKRADIERFQEGEIIVSPMTYPSYISAMIKAAAFVTDEGGALCHAAITARELKKPCIIGTRIATQTVKDGDEIEVDADNGVVRILKKKDEGVGDSDGDISDIIDRNWQKDWEGPFSLLQVSLGVQTYFKGPEKLFGSSLDGVLLIVNNGIMSAYLPTESYEAHGSHLAQMVIDDESVVDTWCEAFTESADNLKELIAELSSDVANAEVLERLREAYSTYGAYQISSKAVVNFLPDQLYGKSEKKFEKARRYSETIYKDAETLIDKLVQNYAGDSEREFSTLTIDELVAGGVSIEEAKKRYEKSGAYLTADDVQILSAQEVDRIKQEWKNLDTGALQGTTAFPGSVTGKCRIITNFEGAEIQEGEILVTGMTDPNYLPLMKKAAAIITDAGGMLSHAAITSRELEKPCIVGMKCATSVLEDGDEIEVDADNGVVRILTKADESGDDRNDDSGLPFNRDEEMFKWGPVPGRYFFMSEFLYVMTDLMSAKYGGLMWPKAVLLFHEGRMLWMNSKEQIEKVAGEIFEGMIVKDGVYGQMRADYQESLKDLKKVCFEIGEAKLGEISDKKFIALWQEFFNIKNAFLLPTIPVELANYGSVSLLRGKLSAVISDEEEMLSAMEILTAPEEMSFYQREEIELQKAVNIEAHAKEYGWLKNSFAGVKELPVKFFEDRKLEIVETVEVDGHARLNRVKARKIEMQEKYGLNDEIMHFARRLSEAIEWQDDRKEHVLRSLVYKSILLHEVARRVGVDYDDLLNFSYFDIGKMILGEDLSGEAEARREGFGIIMDRKVGAIATDRALEFWKMYGEEEVEEGIEQFSGTVASKGDGKVVRGRVKILFRPHQEYFNKGDILVAPMTSPEYVFAMKQSAAIITDTGGLTSHAAIVSRELGKPCIVGSKIATRVLKDGDEVEVDMEKGVVRIV